MTTNIQIFKNARFGEVRVTEVNGTPYFVAKDICEVLEIANNRDAVSRLDEDEKYAVGITDAIGREQQTTVISESGVYELIFLSRKPEARAFKKWVKSEVLPSIRKHGGYLTPQKVEEALLNPDVLIRLATHLKEERIKRIAAEATVEQQKPKVLFADAVAASNKSVLIGELAKVLRQNGVDIGEKRLFCWLRFHKYLCSCGERYNQPSQQAMEMGLFEIKKISITKPDGTVIVSTTTKVTGKGQIYFVNKFLAA